MSNDNEKFLIDLQDLLNTPATSNKRWEKFVELIDNYQPMVKTSLRSIEDFDNLHGRLHDLLRLTDTKDDPDEKKMSASALIDKSQYEVFESVMTDLRRIAESLIMEHCHLSVRLNNVENELNDVKRLLFENEFKKLCFLVSTPLKNVLVKQFRTRNLRIDPLDKTLLLALRSNDYHIGPIDRTLYYAVKETYQKLARDIGIFYHDLIEVIFVRLQRNIQQHESLNEYIDECRVLNITPKFENLIEQMDLTSLFKYKTSQMRLLEKLFNFYALRDEYR
ncbi:unnamed protein product [Rotaria sp. Silwood2]|nr:unnamed protein product [Rotaria sp. Silwood2]CAF4505217.1 unnamed protein product [Rotaria sp. Silwood2]